MRVIIAGGREFNDYNLLEKACDDILLEDAYIEIVSGGARGTDKLGERYANNRNCNLKIFLAEWDELGKKAGYVRNAKMAEYANMLIAFWDGKSKGTKHMIDLANKNNLQVYVIKY